MKLDDDDPGSLNRLHDIVEPAAVPWWPPAPAWYVVGILLMAACGICLAAIMFRWWTNRYRRAGLRELRQLVRAHSNGPQALMQLAELLKRVALAAYPREQVASLAAVDWLQFLDQTANTTAFASGAGRQLLTVYERDPAPPTQELYQLAHDWIRRHRRHLSC